MKSKYEKPVAMPLGEAAKGSGQCNAGSGIRVPSPNALGCSDGSKAYPCKLGQVVAFFR
jgi:hypothetical protein